MPQTSYGGPKPSGGLSLGLPDLGLGGAAGVAAPDDGYGVPAAPVVASNGGSDGYGAPSNEGYGPSSAVSPFSQASQNNYDAPAAPFMWRTLRVAEFSEEVTVSQLSLA